ncbi:MAG: trimethylamine methyltransferase family protein [Candidatus Adiutrix sp.]|jgi:trimethylamine--corrinoid protein Co-methyltransferase|nr:trimethylamine methyltransferase family protein [Candidatus Adiutrix sp.]
MSREQMIHDAAMEIMREVGIRVNNAKAVEIFKKTGLRVEGEIVFFTEDEVMRWVNMAPESFTIQARNPKYNMELGGGRSYPAPAYGCAFIDDWDGNRRPGTMADFIKCLKLIHMEDVYSINGGIMVQPDDIPSEWASIAMFYATLLHSDKAILLPTGSKKEMELMMEVSCELFGGKEAFIEKPRMIALINTVSPLTLDEVMLDCLMALAGHGQAVIVCPAAMLGATGSISMAGTLASGVAESLAGIVLAQMIRPGTPVVFGVQSTAADMRGSITFACAAPEGTLMQGFAANMGKFYKMPSRGGGCQTDAPRVNCQAGYESMLTFSSAYRQGINFILEAGGVMDSVNATSFEKMIIDSEIIRLVKASFTPIEVNEATLNLEEIKKLGHTGSFVTSKSTAKNFKTLYAPRVGVRNANTPDYLKVNIDKEISRLLDKYEGRRPDLDAQVRDKVKNILAKSGLAPQHFESIENM